MTPFPYLRSFCFALVCLFTIDFASAQYLEVPLIPQHNTLTCWAASMEMTMAYHGMPIAGDAQCELTNLYDYYNKRRNNSSPTKLTIPCPATCNQFSHRLNKSIDYSKREGKVSLQFTDMLYAYFGFISQEDMNTENMTWSAIQSEIDACRPFSIFLNYMRQDYPLQYNHVVVAKGYYETADRQFVLINNPQSTTPCVGCEGLMPISIFTDPAAELYSASSVIRSIQPQTRRCDESCNCSDSTTTSSLMAAIGADMNSNSASTFTEIPANTINMATYTSLTTSTTNGVLRFKEFYIDYYPTYFSVDRIKVLVSNINNSHLAYHFTTTGDSLRLKYISEVSCTGFVDSLSFDGIANALFLKKHIVTNEDEGGIGIVKILPNNEHFYRILYKGEYYLSPISKYDHLPFNINYLYEEDKVLDTFKCGERKRLKQLRRLLKRRSPEIDSRIKPN